MGIVHCRKGAWRLQDRAFLHNVQVSLGFSSARTGTRHAHSPAMHVGCESLGTTSEPVELDPLMPWQVMARRMAGPLWNEIYKKLGYCSAICRKIPKLGFSFRVSWSEVGSGYVSS